MAATVKRSTKVKKKKIKVYYDVTAGKPYVVQSIKYDIYDPKIAALLKQDSARSLLKEGMYFDVKEIMYKKHSCFHIWNYFYYLCRIKPN